MKRMLCFLFVLALCGCSKVPAPAPEKASEVAPRAEVVQAPPTPEQEARKLIALGDAKMREGSDTWAFAYYKAANDRHPSKETQNKISRIEDSWEPKDHYGPGSHHESLIPDDLTEEEIKGHVMEILRGGYWFKCWVTPEEQAARMLMSGRMKSQMAIEETRRKVQESDAASNVLLSGPSVRVAQKVSFRESVTSRNADGSSVTIEREVSVENSASVGRRKN